MNHLWRGKAFTIPGPGINYTRVLNYSLVGLNLCRSCHLRTRDGVGMPHARSGGDALRVKGVGTHYQSTVHSLVQMLPWVFGSVLHSSIWWSNNIYVIKHDISCACAITLYKSITCVVDYIWDMEHS
jgi:hypothetical protein